MENLSFYCSVIGTSSLRRIAQLKRGYPNLVFENIVSFQADFDSADFDSADFDSADFDSADFDSADFDSADFDSADFDSADFDSADFDSADFVCESEFSASKNLIFLPQNYTFSFFRFRC